MSESSDGQRQMSLWQDIVSDRWRVTGQREQVYLLHLRERGALHAYYSPEQFSVSVAVNARLLDGFDADEAPITVVDGKSRCIERLATCK